MSFTVAFQGERGAYSELAANNYFKPITKDSMNLLPCESFQSVFEALSEKVCNYGIIPIENSLAGSVHENYDHMKRYKSHIIGEYILRVEHNLLAFEGAKLENIKEVFSHPQAIAQCSEFLNKHKMRKNLYYDTAGSAKMVAEKGDKTIAAIASVQAAEDYNLQILQSSIENNHANFTRFLIITLAPLSTFKKQSGIKYKTSIVFSLKSTPGALFKSLSVFSLRDVDLYKIESRPLVTTPWEYLFYLDFDGFFTDSPVKRALSNLSEVADNIYIFGSYPTK